MSATGTIPVPAGHVGLFLLHDQNPSQQCSSFYLQIPLHIIGSLCLRPRKYLLYLGWCILGVEGVLALEHDGDGIDTNEGGLDDERMYYYITPGDLTHTVDLIGITNASSTQMHEDFRNSLLKRDVCCVWTGAEPVFGAAMHIIPFRRGNDGLRCIVESRPNYDEDVTELRDINDVRNGVFAHGSIHTAFDLRLLAILKTPNHILGIEDIHPRHNRQCFPENVCYPAGGRYTLQWLETPDEFTGRMLPNNCDAVFKEGSERPKPSELLLHYNYGAAAIKQWGHGTEVLKKLANPPRPPESVLPLRPVVAGTSAGAAGSEELLESDEWDEDDVMLFLWANTPAAKERRLKKSQENTQRMEEWRKGVAQGF